MKEDNKIMDLQDNLPTEDSLSTPFLYKDKDKRLKEEERTKEEENKNSTYISSSLNREKTKDTTDVDLSYVASALTKAGVTPELSKDVLNFLSYKGSSLKKERTLASEVEEWVLSTTGIFQSTDVYRGLHLSTREETKNLSIILARFAKKGVIVKVGNKNGHWRKVDGEPVEFMDFKKVPEDEDYAITMPLDIHTKSIFLPKSVIVIAGVTGYGKTTFLLNIIRDNMNKYPFYYFNSEISPRGLNRKLSYFMTTIESWKMKVIGDEYWDCTNIQDRIYPDAINVIDYLEPEGDRTYSIHDVITAITKRLNKGMAFIAVQKKPGNDMGTGGVYSAKAASLYLALDWGKIKIVKNRYREEDKFPAFTTRSFEISPGQHIKPIGGWTNESGASPPKKYPSYEPVPDDEFVREE